MSLHLLTYLEDKVSNLDEELDQFAQIYLNSLAQIQLEDHKENIPGVFKYPLKMMKANLSIADDHKDDLVHAMIWYYNATKNGAQDAYDLVDEIFDGRFTLGLRLSGHTPLRWTDEEVAEYSESPMPVICETYDLLQIMQILTFREKMTETNTDKRSALWRKFSCQLIALPIER